MCVGGGGRGGEGGEGGGGEGGLNQLSPARKGGVRDALARY